MCRYLQSQTRKKLQLNVEDSEKNMLGSVFMDFNQLITKFQCRSGIYWVGTLLVMSMFALVKGQSYYGLTDHIFDSSAKYLDSSHNLTHYENEDRDPTRFKVGLFPKSFKVLDREVTCEHSDLHEIYVEPTWACDNIKVDGYRLPYAYIGDNLLANNYIEDDYYLCGTYTPDHDSLALCSHFFQAYGFDAEVQFAMVTKSSCEAKENGILFTKNASSNSYSWKLKTDMVGYTISLRCSALRPRN